MPVMILSWRSLHQLRNTVYCAIHKYMETILAEPKRRGTIRLSTDACICDGKVLH